MSKPIFFLPGTMCDHRLWSDMAEEFNRLGRSSARFHYLAVAPLPTIDEILLEIKSHLPSMPVTVVGFSLGGYLANALAVKYPELIEKLIIIGNMPNVLPEAEIKSRKRTINWIQQNGYQGIPHKRVLAFLDASAHNNEKVINTIKAMDADLGGDTLVHQIMVTTKRENLSGKLITLPFKKYFCVGKNDHLVAFDALTNMVASDPNMTLTTFENTGHMLPLEQPKALAVWLKSLID